MAYKTFANGFPLPASDLNNFLMNQSVIVFADSAARTTAIPSPVEGMLTYLEDTNAYESWNGSAFVALAEEPDLTALIPKSTVTTAEDLIVADGASSVTRLGVGTDDQVLSVVAGSVAWADAGGGDRMTLIATETVVFADSINLVTFASIPGTYTDLILRYRNYKNTTSALNQNVVQNQFDNNFSWVFYAGGTQYASTGWGGETNNSINTDYHLRFFNYTDSAKTAVSLYGCDRSSNVVFGAGRNANTSLTELNISNGYSNDLEGTFELWGVI